MVLFFSGVYIFRKPNAKDAENCLMPLEVIFPKIQTSQNRFPFYKGLSQYLDGAVTKNYTII